MRSSIFFFAIMLLVVFASCSNGSNDKAFNQYLATADSTKFSSDITDPHSASRKILHSADLSYRVGDVLKATTLAEQLVKNLGGIVTKSEMHNETVSVKDMPYKSDSLKRTQIYAPVGTLVVQVPVDKMDSFIGLLSASAQFVNHRVIAQQDMTYTYLTNALKNQNTENNGKPAHYTAPATNSKELLAERTKSKEDVNEQVDRRVENLRMLEATNYATLAISFNQPEQIDVQVTADPAYATQTPFGTRLAEALRNGISIFREILLLVVQLWPVWMILAVILVIYRRRKKRVLVGREG